MSVCDRKTFNEILIGLVLFSLTSTPVLAGSAGDLKPRVPPEQLKEAQSFQNPFHIFGRHRGKRKEAL